MLFKKKMDRRKIAELSLLLGFLLTVIVCCRFSAFAQTAASVREDTLRLHIRANSDSDRDQQLKLEVRDAILAASDELWAGEPDKAGALAAAQASLPHIEQIARRTLAAKGCYLPVRAYLTRMDFETTAYRDFVLPAGAYDALRVEIGSHEGHNWFCVLYPGLCLPAAEGEQLYPEKAQQELVDSRPMIRFALLDWVEKVMELFRERLA